MPGQEVEMSLFERAFFYSEDAALTECQCKRCKQKRARESANKSEPPAEPPEPEPEAEPEPEPEPETQPEE